MGMEGRSGHWRLYALMWQQLVLERPTSVALRHLSRYWAMAATYDGLGASFLLWAALVASMRIPGTLPEILNLRMTLTGVGASLLASLLCFRQGMKYYEYQVEDLVAVTVAGYRGPGETSPRAT
jgi:hypothetical protein